MNESMDRVLADWLDEGPDRGPSDSLGRVLAATRGVSQRPGWSFPERWFPMQLTLVQSRSPRPLLTITTLALLTVALVATALLIGSQRLPFRNGAVVWAEYGHLYIADELEGSPRRLLSGPETDSDPLFSPAGDRIAFERVSPDGIQVMAVDADGSGLTDLAILAATAVDLEWSPDGGAILASTSEGVYDTGIHTVYQVYVIDSDGGGIRRLDTVGSGAAVASASWRPSGRHIAYRGEDELGQAVFIADSEGATISQLPIRPTYGGGLDWSPDGKHLSYTTDENDDDTGQIVVVDVDADGTVTQSRTLLAEAHSVGGPTWSPDGARLAFQWTKAPWAGLGIVNADGSGYRMIGPQVPWPARVDFIWSPDGGSLILREPAGRAWSVDVATGDQTEVQNPVASWQRLAP